MLTNATSPPPSAERWGGALGLIAVAGNAAGVGFLWEVPGAYKPDRMDSWLAGVASHPQAVEASAAAFVLGLLAMAGWAVALRRRSRSPAARAGLAAVAAGAIVNGAGCVAPLVLARHVLPACAPGGCQDLGRALLGVTLTLDALFNGLLGAGLLLSCAPAAVRQRGRTRALAIVGTLAGAASLPVALQYRSAGAAALLAVAGPLWLAYVGWTSFRMLGLGPRAAGDGALDPSRPASEGGGGGSRVRGGRGSDPARPSRAPRPATP